MKRTIILTLFITTLFGVVHIGRAQTCPELVLEMPTEERFNAIDLHSQHAYITEEIFAIHIYDLSSPASPEKVGIIPSDDLPGGVVEVLISRTILYAVYYSTPAFRQPYTSGFAIFDISDPSNPIKRGTYSENGLMDTYNDILIVNDLAYLVGGTGWLKVIDVSDPANPFELNDVEVPDEHFGSITRIAHYLYLTFSDGFYIVDIADPLHPILIEDPFPVNSPGSIAVRYPYAYFDGLGLTILDISDPSAPVLVNSLEEPYLRKVEIKENILYAISGEIVYIYDLVDPVNLILRGSYTNTALVPRDISIDTSYAYLVNSAYSGGGVLTVLDISACRNEGVLYIPAAANKTGAHATNWKTDVVLHNRGLETITATLTFLQTGLDNSDAEPSAVTIQPATSLTLNDIVGTFFSLSNVSGAIKVESYDDLVLSSRTYNDLGEEGTYGQSIPARKLEEGITDLTESRLVHLVHDGNYHTNIGFVNATGGISNLTVTLYRDDGTELGSLPYTLLPYEYYQENAIFTLVTNDPVPGGYVVVTTTTPGARCFAYASVVDNRTGDAIYIPHQ